MAKIENTTVYPTVIPSMEDLLIATDVSNSNETVTFLVSDLIGVSGVLQGLQSVLDTNNTAVQTMDLTGDINLLGGPGVGFLETCQIKLGGGYGSPGDVVTSKGPGECAVWEAPAAASCCGWEDTLIIDPATSVDAFIQGSKLIVSAVAGGGIDILSPSTLTNSGTSVFTGVTSINGTELSFNATGQINDSTGSIGTAGQWLTSLGPGAGVEWSSTVPAGGCCTLQDTIAAGNTTVGQSIVASGTGMWTLGLGNDITSAGSNIWRGMNNFSGVGIGASDFGIKITGTLYDGISVGTAGQVLTSTATGVLWAASGAGSQNLQQVLDIGNSASGVNASITLTGANATIDPTTITDGSGSVGGAGMVLSSTGTALAWISNACCNLDDTLAIGSTSASSITLTGTANITSPFMTPTLIYDSLGATGAAGEVLTINAGATGIEWTTAAAGAVTSVTDAASTSTGTPITILPTTGAVVVTSNKFAGSSNVGFVPDSSASSQTTTFLRADGSWQVPTATAISSTQVIRIDFGLLKINYTSNHYMIYRPFPSATPSESHQYAPTSIGSAVPLGITTAGEHMNATVIGNPALTSCSGGDQITLCDATTTVVSSRSSGVVRVNLWKTELCPSSLPATYIVAMECDITLGDDTIECCNAAFATAGEETLEKGYGYVLTWKLIDISDGSLDLQGTIYLRVNHHSS